MERITVQHKGESPSAFARLSIRESTESEWMDTPERRSRQSRLIREWKPWKRSTGPRSPKGKDKSSRNACKGYSRELMQEVTRFLRNQKSYIDYFN